MLHTFGFSSFFFFVFVQNSLENLFSLFFAIVKAVVICADDDDAKVDGEVSDVNVQNEVFWDSWDADRSPSFATVFHAGISVNVIHEHLDVGGFHLCDLFWVGENGYWVHWAD